MGGWSRVFFNNLFISKGFLPIVRDVHELYVFIRKAFSFYSEYLDLLRDSLASELTSQRYVIRENVKTCSG